MAGVPNLNTGSNNVVTVPVILPKLVLTILSESRK
jgi:hypothetical protein